MRFGKTRFGKAHFGSSVIAGSSAPGRLQLGISGQVSALASSGEGRGSINARSTGSLSAVTYGPPATSATMAVGGAGAISALNVSPPPFEKHLAILGVGALDDTVLTTAAKHPELTATVSPARDIPERERIEGYLKRPFETNYPAVQSGGVLGPGEWAGVILDEFGGVAQAMTRIRNDVLASHLVDLAYGQSLDNLGTLLLLPRRTGEVDSHYRIRLKAHARSLTGEATVDQVRETLALLLQCQVEDIKLTEPDEPARFDLRVDRSILDAAAVTIDDVIDLVTRFRAGGVEVTLSVSGSFTYRSIEDFETNTDLGEKGYNESYYSGRII